MPNSDGTGNAWDGLKNIGIGLIFAAAIVFAGTSIRNNWLLIPVCTVCTAIPAWLITRKADKKTEFKTIATWGAIGLIAGFVWWITA